MSMLAALLLLTGTTAPAAEAPPPRPQASAVGIARVRILAPVRLQQQLGEPALPPTEPRATHRAPRRDGAVVVDMY